MVYKLIPIKMLRGNKAILGMVPKAFSLFSMFPDFETKLLSAQF